MKKIVILFLGLVLSVSSLAFAADVDFNISVDKRTITSNEAIYLNLNFTGTQDIPVLDLTSIEGFSVRYVGPSSKISSINGKTTVSLTHIYILVPLRTGTFQIGPFSFDYKGETYISNSETVNVTGSPVAGQSSEENGWEDNIFLTMEVNKNQFYLNEIFAVKIKLYIRDDLKAQNIHYPQLRHEGFSLSKITDQPQYRDIVGGRYFSVIEFTTDAFATQTGSLNLGPASLQCDVLIPQKNRRAAFSFDDLDSFFSDFFSTAEKYPLTLNSPKIPLDVLSLPPEDKPAGFSGAIGDFSFNVEANPCQLNAGDPVTLRLIVKGEGNFDTVRFLSLNFDQQDFKIYDPQITAHNNTKIFEYVVIPKNETIKNIPEISFSFFNPQTASYQTLTKGPFPITVTKPVLAQDIKIVELAPEGTKQVLTSQKLGRDIIYIKESPGKFIQSGRYLYKNKLFLTLYLLPLLIFLLMLRIHKHYYKLKTDQGYARKLKAPQVARRGLKQAEEMFGENHAGQFYAAIFKTLQQYLGYRFHIPCGGITADVTKILEEKNVSGAVTEKIKSIIQDCDLARYAPLEFDRAKMKRTLDDLKTVIDYLGRKKK